jgi:hypothetical protein
MKNKERKHMGRKKEKHEKRIITASKQKILISEIYWITKKILMNQFVKFSFIILINMVMEK